MGGLSGSPVVSDRRDGLKGKSADDREVAPAQITPEPIDIARAFQRLDPAIPASSVHLALFGGCHGQIVNRVLTAFGHTRALLAFLSEM